MLTGNTDDEIPNTSYLYIPRKTKFTNLITQGRLFPENTGPLNVHNSILNVGLTKNLFVH